MISFPITLSSYLHYYYLLLFLLKEAGLSEKKKNLRVGIDTPLECYMDDHWYKHIINEVDRDNYKADNYLNKLIIMCEVIGVNPD